MTPGFGGFTTAFSTPAMSPSMSAPNPPRPMFP
jgi:hypothetical protein